MNKWLVLLLFFYAAACPAGIRWRWSNPVPHGNNINATAYSESLGYFIQVTDKGQIYSSDDRLEWISRSSGSNSAVRSICFLGNRAVYCGENSLVGFADTLTNFITSNLGAADWLEGIAAAGTNLVVAAGDNGAIYTSTNGIHWVNRPQSFKAWLRSIAYGLTNFVAVGEDGFIASSPDGIKWETQTSGTTQHLNNVFFSGTQFWVSGDRGVLLRSASGSNWQRENAGTTNVLFAGAFHDFQLIVGGQQELRMRDGTNWFSQIAATHPQPAPVWTYLSGLWAEDMFAFGGSSGMWVLGARDTNNFMRWTDPFFSPRPWLWDVARIGENFIAVGDRGSIMTSPDGINWDFELPVPGLRDSVLLSVAGNPTNMVAAGSNGSLVSSTNGYIWSLLPNTTPNDLHGICYDGKLFVAVGGEGTILTSPDGRNWTKRNSGSVEYLSGVCASPSGYVVVGRGGTILTSTNGIIWSSRASNTTNWLYRAASIKNRMVAVGQNGTIITSTNGVQWQRQESKTTRWLNGIAENQAGNEVFVVGVTGTILRSADLSTWEPVETITRKSLYGVATHLGKIIVTGLEGVVLRSYSGARPQPAMIESYSRANGQHVFFVVGGADQQIRIEHSTDLIHWVSSPEYKTLDRWGTSIFNEEDLTNSDKLFLRVQSWFEP